MLCNQCIWGYNDISSPPRWSKMKVWATPSKLHRPHRSHTHMNKSNSKHIFWGRYVIPGGRDCVTTDSQKRTANTMGWRGYDVSPTIPCHPLCWSYIDAFRISREHGESPTTEMLWSIFRQTHHIFLSQDSRRLDAFTIMWLGTTIRSSNWRPQTFKPGRSNSVHHWIVC